jgi:D-apionolactonase
MTERAIALYGTAEKTDTEVALTAGPLSALFVNGALRSIRLQDVEVIRGISFLIRDRNWATVVPELGDLAIERTKDGFRVSFVCRGATPSDGQTLAWRGEIKGSASRGIEFTAEATPDSDVVTCRTGFVVLHPLEKVVGCPVTIEHSDGRLEETAFPDHIDPLQAFFDIRAMTHEPIPGVRATCRMTGGAWETEDHRNWLDASFKTYFRPLALPWPYTLPAGETIAQTVSLTFAPSIVRLRPLPADPVATVAVGDRVGLVMPEIGLAAEPADFAATLAAADKLRPAGVRNLALRIAADTPDLPGVLRQGGQAATALGAAPALEIVLPGKHAPDVELDLVAVAAASAGFRPRAVVVSPAIDLRSYPPSVDRPAGPPLEAVYAAARRAFPGLPLGGGMFSYFTELNRRRPPVHLLDFVQHATASIVHAADDRSVMETLESLPHVFRSARGFIGDRAYRVGPANIGMGFNPYGAATTPNPDRRRLAMATEDPRQGALFGAAWALGYLIRAAQGGIESVTIMAPTGPFGILDAKARPRPAFRVVQGFADLAGAALFQTASSDPQRLLGLAAERAGRRSLWLANLTPERRKVALAGFRPSRLAVMDEAAGATLAARPLPKSPTLELGAYAVARLEG